MTGIFRAIAALLASVALLQFGNGLYSTLLTLRGASEGFSTLVLGLIMSGYFVGFVGGTWTSGRLIARMGHIRTFGFCAAIAASIALINAIWIDPWLWIVLRVIYGLVFIALMTVIESWLNSQAGAGNRGLTFALYMVVNLGALALAQQGLRIAPIDGFVLFSVVAIFISWALLPITSTRRVQPTVVARPKSSLWTWLGFAPLAVVSAGLSGLAMGAFWGLAPVYAYRLGFDTSGVSVMMSATIAGGALLQIPIGRFSDHGDRRRVMTWVTFAAAALAALMPWAPNHMFVMVLFGLWGGAAFSLYPLAVAQLIDQLRPEEIVAGSADMLVVQGLGSALGPLMAAAVMSWLGPQGLPWYIAIVLAALGAYSLYRRRRVSPLTAGEAAHFEPMVQSGPEAMALLGTERQLELFEAREHDAESHGKP
ncbi:MFS transporter [Salinisphaera hydrothermalis]|uniref:MFS transporter n=1 Tax=Salinisphaera hydrothermalis TaxID=563188 RepID=UPI003340EADF